jgi:hypothetical protein
MLRSLKALEGYTVSGTDGDVGAVVGFLLDDERWTVRYLVVETGGSSTGHQVLISPISFRLADWATRCFHVALTMEKIENSPGVDTDLPVSRLLERDLSRYYDYPRYWASPGIWGAGAFPNSLAVGGWSDVPAQPDEQLRDAHLRSVREVLGYHLHGSDGAIGHVTDFLVDDGTWEVRYLVVDTGHWWTESKKVLVSPRWATSVSWEEREVRVGLTRQAVLDSPEWSVSAALDRTFEARLRRHHGRREYGDDDAAEQARRSTPSDSHVSE